MKGSRFSEEQIIGILRERRRGQRRRRYVADGLHPENSANLR